MLLVPTLTPSTRSPPHRNTDILNTCIVFRGWRITSLTGFALSCAAVAALSILYELLRVSQRALDERIARALALSAAAVGDVKATGGGSDSPAGSRVSLVAPTSESGLLPRHMLSRAPRTGCAAVSHCLLTRS